MEDLLYCKDLHSPLAGISAKPEKTSDEDWQKIDRKAIGFIRQWLDDSVFHHVSTESTSKSLWEKLESLYERKTAGNKAFLIRKLVNLKYKEGSSIAEHLNEMQSVINQLSSMKMTIDDEMQALLLLSSLPDSWETLVVSLSNSAPDGVVTMSLVTSSLLNEELRRKALGPSHSQALITENRGRSKSYDRGPRSNSRPRSKSRSRGIICYHCNKRGHVRRDCRKLKKEIEEKGEGTSDAKENTAATTVGDLFFVSSDKESCLCVTCQDTDWVIDSGASFHATPRRDFFTSYQSGDFGIVKMGNKDTSSIVGRGDVHLETGLGCKLVLKDVRHIPDLRLNLISPGRLDDEGYTNVLGNGQWKLSRGSLVIARGKKCCTLYKTQATLCIGQVNATEADSSLELWHRRLGHMSEKGLQILAKGNYLPSAKGTHLDTCVHCLAGKQHRVSFNRNSSHRKSRILDLVHSDVCGPMRTKTFGGAVYFATFIDDHSRKVWAYPLKSKDQVLNVFREFHVMVERETGRSLKCIRSDNGGEYIGPFDEYCRAHGIRHERTVPKTPEQNGVAERMNRTIVEKVRCMLSHSKLPKPFWGEAMNTAVRLINLSPSVPLNGDVPEKVWTGKEVSFKHLRVFGCRAFAHIPKDERSKLDGKARECIFLGYADEKFGYRLWDLENKKVIRSRDVVFLEDQTIEDLKKKETSQTTTSNVVDPDLISSIPERTEEAQEDTSVPTQEEEGEQPAAQPPVAPQLRRSTREHQPNTRYPTNEYVMITDAGEPEDFDEVQNDQHKKEWLKAMQEEMDALHENHTYDLVKLPEGKKALKNKWVFRLKTEEDNFRPRYKARLVVKGFTQKKGIDFEEIFSPVVKMSSIRVVLAIAASMNLEVEQLDVKTAFLHGDLHEEIYMEQPEGFKVKGKEDMMCKLKKSLYGLKQAPRQWYKKFDSFMIDHGYQRTNVDHCVYIRRFGNDFIILLLYVDDMLIVGKDISEIVRLKKELSKSFAMKDLGPAKQILGMRIFRERKANKLWLSQEQYIEKILARFDMDKAKPVGTPLAGHFKLSSSQSPSSEKKKSEMEKIPYSSAVGSLMYAMVCTRPDLAHAVGVVSRFLSNPGKEHWAAVKWIFRYLRGTSKLCLCFGDDKPVLVGYTDADMAGDIDSRKSTSGYLITFAGGAVSWQSKLQKCVALSTTEAEYIAITEACKEMLWMKRFLIELGINQNQYIVYCDSQSAIHLSKNSSFHYKSKHIDIRYHWIRNILDEKLLQLEKIHTDRNGSDMLTKALPTEKQVFCQKVAGMDFR